MYEYATDLHSKYCENIRFDIFPISLKLFDCSYIDRAPLQQNTTLLAPQCSHKYLGQRHHRFHNQPQLLNEILLNIFGNSVEWK